MKRKLSAGSTSVQLPIFIADTNSVSGGGIAGLTSVTVGLVAEYRRSNQAAPVAIPLVAGTLGTFTAGGFVADGTLAGAYELSVPDAAFAAGARWVIIRLYGAANMPPVLIEIEIDAVNYQDSAAFGLSRLDQSVGSRLATTGYTAPPTAGAVATATRTELATELGRIDTNVASRSSHSVLDIWNVLATNVGIADGSLGKRIVSFLTGNAYDRLGQPAGASIAADLVAINTAIAAVPNQAVAALMGNAYITIDANHTTIGNPLTLTFKQWMALQDAIVGGDNSSSAPIANGQAKVSYYLRGQAKSAVTKVAEATVTYDGNRNQTTRTVIVQAPFPAIPTV